MPASNIPRIPNVESLVGKGSGEKVYSRLKINPNVWVIDPNNGNEIKLVDFIGSFIPVRGFHSLTREQLENTDLSQLATLAQWPQGLLAAITEINNSPHKINARVNSVKLGKVFRGFDRLSQSLVKESMKIDMTESINKTLSHLYANTDIGFSVKPMSLVVNWDDTIKVDPRANLDNLMHQNRTEFNEYAHINPRMGSITLNPKIANPAAVDADFDKINGVYVNLYKKNADGTFGDVINSVFLGTKWPYHTNQVGYLIDNQYDPNAKWFKTKGPSLENLAKKQVEMAKKMKLGTEDGDAFFKQRLKASLVEDLIGQNTSKEYARSRRYTEGLIREMPKILSQHVDGVSEAQAAQMWNKLTPSQKELFMWKTENRISSGRQLRIQETAIKQTAGKELDFGSDELRAVLLHDYTMDRLDQALMFPNAMGRMSDEVAAEAIRSVIFSEDNGFGKIMGVAPQNFRKSTPYGIYKPKPTPVPRMMFDGSGKITTKKGTRSSILDALMTPDEHGKALLVAQKVKYPFDPVTGMKLQDQYGYIISANGYDETGQIVPKPLVGTVKGGLEDVVYMPTILERDGSVVDPLQWLGEEMERRMQNDPKFNWRYENGFGELSGPFTPDGLLNPRNSSHLRELAEANGTTVEHVKLLAIGRSEHDIQKLRSFKTKLDSTKFNGLQQIRELMQEILGVGTQTRMMRGPGDEFFPTGRRQIQELSKVMLLDRRATGGDPADIADDLMKIHAFTPMTAAAKLKDKDLRMIGLVRANPGSILESVGADNAYADPKRKLKALSTLADVKFLEGEKTFALIDFQALDERGYGNPDILQPISASEGFLAISEKLDKERGDIRESIGRPVKRQGMIVDEEGNLRLQQHILPGKMSYIKDGQTLEIDAALGIGEAEGKSATNILKKIAQQAGALDIYQEFERTGDASGIQQFLSKIEAHKIEAQLMVDGKQVNIPAFIFKQRIGTRMSESDIAVDTAESLFSGEVAGRALMDKSFGLARLTGIPLEEVADRMWQAADSSRDIDPEMFPMAKKLFELRGLSVPSLSQQGVRENLEIVGQGIAENSAEMLGRQIAHSAVANGMGRAEAVQFFIKMLGM